MTEDRPDGPGSGDPGIPPPEDRARWARERLQEEMAKIEGLGAAAGESEVLVELDRRFAQFEHGLAQRDAGRIDVLRAEAAEVARDEARGALREEVAAAEARLAASAEAEVGRVQAETNRLLDAVLAGLRSVGRDPPGGGPAGSGS